MASFEVKMEEFKQKFEQKDRLKYAFFTHFSSSKSNLKENTIVIFDVVPLNIGSAYDGTTGKFTCKEDGIYTFSWTTLSNSNTDFTSALVVDGTPIASNAVDNDETGDALTGSISVIVKMTKGQEAWIKAVGSQGIMYMHHGQIIYPSVFSGFKI
ncbi:C1QL [Mytilus edulis]|uniref:C1QL n=1 Tax=Mytilus edulis TaxID=6550 RepID=A0A8S3QSQ5_MYTED|nr:C1QL [Mytilus edulis]